MVCDGLRPHLHELFGSDKDGSRARWPPHLAPMPVAELGHVPESFAPAGWDQLLHKLLNERAKKRAWQLDDRAREGFAG